MQMMFEYKIFCSNHLVISLKQEVIFFYIALLALTLYYFLATYVKIQIIECNLLVIMNDYETILYRGGIYEHLVLISYT
jgi:hypothetical protein